MTGLLYGLGRFCVRRRLIVLVAWLAIFVALAAWARALGPEVNDNLTLPGTDSQRATDLLADRFPSQANGTNPVVLQAPDGKKITASEFKQPIDDTVKALKADPDVRSATNPLTSDGAALLAKDKAIGYIALNLKPSPTELSTDDAERIVALADPARAAGLDVGFGGYLGQKVSKPDTHISEVIGLSMAVIVLLITFGTVVAMGLPIITAVVGLVCGLSIITLLSQFSEVPTVAPTLATMIGLGVGIDYALFIVTRHLEQRRDGMATRESIARACATSGGAVVFAGCTVMVALLSLAVVGIPLVTTLGYTSALVVAVAVVAAITLLPALLGHRRRPDRPAARSRCRTARPTTTPTAGAAGGRTSRATRSRPRSSRSSCCSCSPLPALDLYLGQQDNGAMPESTDVRRASDGLTAGFGAGRERAAARQRRPVRQAGEARPEEPGQARPATAAAQGQASSRPTQQASSSRPGLPPDQAQANRRSSRRSRSPTSSPTQRKKARAARDRPAAAGPARRPQEDERRRRR